MEEPLQRPVLVWEYYVYWHGCQWNRMWGCGMDSSGSGEVPVVGSYEHVMNLKIPLSKPCS